MDREWVSLFGKIEERTGKKQVIGEGNENDKKEKSGVSKFTMNADCMSCTDNLSTNLNLFKIACINYLPNPVYYQGQTIQRQELISLQRVITNMAKDSVE